MNPYETPTFPMEKLWLGEISSLHARLDSCLARLSSPFTEQEFMHSFGVLRLLDYGYKSLENLLIFRGCVLEGMFFSYDKNSALKNKVMIAAAHLEQFTFEELKKKYSQLFLTSHLYHQKCGFASIQHLLMSIPGLRIVQNTQKTPETYYIAKMSLPVGLRDVRPIWDHPPPPAGFLEATRERRHVLFLKNAVPFAKKLKNFTAPLFTVKWRMASSVFPYMSPTALGFRNIESLIQSIPGVRSVLRRGEELKFFVSEEEKEEGEVDDDEDEENNIYKERQTKQYKDVLVVARSLKNPFREKELHDALAKLYNIVDRNELFRFDDPKVPVFLEAVPGIKHLDNGLYEYESENDKSVIGSTKEGQNENKDARSVSPASLEIIFSSENVDDGTTLKKTDLKDSQRAPKKSDEHQKGVPIEENVSGNIDNALNESDANSNEGSMDQYLKEETDRHCFEGIAKRAHAPDLDETSTNSCEEPSAKKKRVEPFPNRPAGSSCNDKLPDRQGIVSVQEEQREDAVVNAEAEAAVEESATISANIPGPKPPQSLYDHILSLGVVHGQWAKDNLNMIIAQMEQSAQQQETIGGTGSSMTVPACTIAQPSQVSSPASVVSPQSIYQALTQLIDGFNHQLLNYLASDAIDRGVSPSELGTKIMDDLFGKRQPS